VKRWWIVIALLLSLGVNVGLLASVAVRRMSPPQAALPAGAGPGPEGRQPGPEGPARPGAAPEGPEGPPANNPARLVRLADHLGLEGETRRRFLEVQWRFFERTARLRFRQGEVHRELRRTISRGEPDRRRIDALLDESARLFRGLEEALVESVVESRAILPPQEEREYLRLVGRLRRQGPPALEGQRPQRRPLPPWERGPRDRFPGREEPGAPQLPPEDLPYSPD
jgi:hypothetical protein